MTEQECIKWAQGHLPFAMRSKKGKLMFPFKSSYFAREIEKALGKDLFKLLSEQKEFCIWIACNVASYSENNYNIIDAEIWVTTLDELYEYWTKEVKPSEEGKDK